MSDIEFDSNGRVGVAASVLVDATQEFTKKHNGEDHTGLQIITLALMHGIEIGYRTAQDNSQRDK